MMEQRDNRMETLLAQTVQDVMTMSNASGSQFWGRSPVAGQQHGLRSGGGWRTCDTPTAATLKSGCAFGTSARPP